MFVVCSPSALEPTAPSKLIGFKYLLNLWVTLSNGNALSLPIFFFLTTGVFINADVFCFTRNEIPDGVFKKLVILSKSVLALENGKNLLPPLMSLPSLPIGLTI